MDRPRAPGGLAHDERSVVEKMGICGGLYGAGAGQSGWGLGDAGSAGLRDARLGKCHRNARSAVPAAAGRGQCRSGAAMRRMSLTAELDRIAAAGFTWVRQPFLWQDIEPEPGAYRGTRTMRSSQAVDAAPALAVGRRAGWDARLGTAHAGPGSSLCAAGQRGRLRERLPEPSPRAIATRSPITRSGMSRTSSLTGATSIRARRCMSPCCSGLYRDPCCRS